MSSKVSCSGFPLLSSRDNRAAKEVDPSAGVGPKIGRRRLAVSPSPGAGRTGHRPVRLHRRQLVGIPRSARLAEKGCGSVSSSLSLRVGGSRTKPTKQGARDRFAGRAGEIVGSFPRLEVGGGHRDPPALDTPRAPIGGSGAQLACLGPEIACQSDVRVVADSRNTCQPYGETI